MRLESINFKILTFFFFQHRNSKPLPLSEGYWAEPWPVSETPLCAVIDPTRDYRWHALRCGGPETAAFMCEMESEFILSTPFQLKFH